MSAPEFEKEMSDCVVVEGAGDAAMFQVQIKGDPEPEVTWFNPDGNELAENKRVRFEEDDDAVFQLKIYNVGADDDGTYKCVIKNSHGQASCEAELIFEELP